MKILITGATGLVGQKLLEHLFLKNFSDINVLTRNAVKASESSQFPVNFFEWAPDSGKIDTKAFEGVDTVIHLAGESVAKGRWTQKKKQEILDSRTKGTNLLMETIAKLSIKPKKVISASAIGIYGDNGRETFLADVCRKWEAPITNHKIEGLTAHVLRIGIVLSADGGALKEMLPPFKMGVAGPLGNGKQFMSWIHIEDLVGQIIHLVENNPKETIHNGVSPTPVTNKEFTKILAKVLHRPAFLPVPALALKIIFGEMSDILLTGQKVLPETFLQNGYQFKFSQLEAALSDLLKFQKNGEHQLVTYQWVNKPLDVVFDFFSDEMNLEKITPPFLNFKVTGKTDPKIQKGTLINYKLSLHGIPLKWKTRINEFEHRKMFIDEQLSGPYSKWVHTHEFLPVKNGVLIKDQVVYKIPMGPAGNLLGHPFIKKDLQKIFNYRKSVISNYFSN